MSKYRHFRVVSKSREHFVDLAVDVEVLTQGHAADINALWHNAEHRQQTANGDAVLAVIRMFGAHAINHARYVGGWAFSHRPFDQGLIFAQQVIDADGERWPDAQELGIAVVGAGVAQETCDTVSAAEN